MKKTLYGILLCFIILGVQSVCAKEATSVVTTETEVTFDIDDVIENPAKYMELLEVYVQLEDITGYKLKDSTVMFVDLGGELVYDGSYFGDHDGSLAKCEMPFDAMEYAECYMKEHFEHYGYVEFSDYTGDSCIASDLTGERYIIQFGEM